MKSMFFSKTGSLSPVLFAPIMALLLISQTACNRGNSDEVFFKPLSVYNERIASYYDASVGRQPSDIEGNLRIYVDCSDGIYSAITTPVIQSTIEKVTQKFFRAADWYQLGLDREDPNSNGIKPIPVQNERDIYAFVTNQENYNTTQAPLEETLKQIVSGKNDALLITDFEEYSNGQIVKAGWAADYFIRWINAGNKIKFYYYIYDEIPKGSKASNGTKNLYFAIFTYGSTEKENGLLKLFDEALEPTNLMGSLKSFVIDPHAFLLSNNYGGKEKTGLLPKVEEGDDQAALAESYEKGNSSEILLNYQNGLNTDAQKKNFEAFDFGIDLATMSQDFKVDFLGGLTLNVEEAVSKVYTLTDINVDVRDVTEDYIKFIKWQEATTEKNIPTEANGMLTRNNNDPKDLKWDADNVNAVTKEAYIENTAQLNSAVDYQRQPEIGTSIAELFDVDKQAILKQFKVNTAGKAEIKIKFHPNFKKENFNTKDKIYRVDILLESDNQYPAQLQDFNWVTKAGGANPSLYEAITRTIQEAKPKGISYSYYLKFNQ
jgi:hypothetical protein